LRLGSVCSAADGGARWFHLSPFVVLTTFACAQLLSTVSGVRLIQACARAHRHCGQDLLLLSPIERNAPTSWRSRWNPRRASPGLWPQTMPFCICRSLAGKLASIARRLVLHVFRPGRQPCGAEIDDRRHRPTRCRDRARSRCQSGQVPPADYPPPRGHIMATYHPSTAAIVARRASSSATTTSR